MPYCENCGASLSENAKFCSACGSPCGNKEAEEPRKFCQNCGSKLEYNDLFCPECGEPCCTLEEYENGMANGEKSSANTFSSNNDDNSAPSSGINWMCLILLAGCVIFWLTAPFIAINILTLGNQPTALQLVMDDVTYIGELTESTAFWAAVISIVGIIICFISTIASAHTATRIVAAVTELPLVLAMVDMINWADDIEELFDALGPGFWGIFILLFAVICASGNRKKVDS